jgi:hypothetical protein
MSTRGGIQQLMHRGLIVKAAIMATFDLVYGINGVVY